MGKTWENVHEVKGELKEEKEYGNIDFAHKYKLENEDMEPTSDMRGDSYTMDQITHPGCGDVDGNVLIGKHETESLIELKSPTKTEEDVLVDLTGEYIENTDREMKDNTEGKAAVLPSTGSSESYIEFIEDKISLVPTSVSTS